MKQFNYTVSSIKVKSNWFDIMDRKKNTYQKMTYKGLNLYFQLHKFRLHNQEDTYTFVTSISLLRKETGYATEEIFDLLKKLKSTKVIKIENVSRWDYLLDENGNVKDKEVIVITASDLPKTERKQRTDKQGKPMFKDKEKQEPIMIDSPATEDDYYIAVSFSMLEYYKHKKKLNERYYAMYCLISRWNKGYIDGKMNMKIEKMAKCLDFDKDTIHRMIIEMNRKEVLSSHRRVRKQGGYRFEHYLLTKCDEDFIKQFLENEQEYMARLVKRADKRASSKRRANVEEDMEESIDTEEVKEAPNEIKSDEPMIIAFGNKKGEVYKTIGKPDPFEEDLDYLFE
jgi:predicted transcriptional regulator